MKYQSLSKLLLVIVVLQLSVSAFGQDYEVDLDFTPPVFDFRRLNTMEITTGGKILVGGLFVDVTPGGGPRIIRLNADGTNDSTFNSPLQGITHEDEVLSIRTLPDGKILLGGKFPSMGAGVQVLRLNSNGTVDNSLTVRPVFTGSSTVLAEPLADGKFLACGFFTQAGGTAINGLARFNSDGTIDNTFATVLGNSSGDPRCYDIKTLASGKLLVTGSFTSVNSVDKSGGARLNSDGTLDASYTLQVPGGNISLGQNDSLLFTYVANYSDPQFPLEIFFDTGFRRNNVESGAFVGSFPCVTRVNSTPLVPFAYGLADGRTLLTGGCTSPLNNAKYALTRVNANSTFDSTLDRVDFGTGTLSYLTRQPDGKLVVLGNFTTVNGVARRNIVRLQSKTRPTSKPDFDFDGDGKADLAVYRPSQGYWYINLSSGGYTYLPFGLATDKPIAADYDNDGKADIAVYRDGSWYIIRSSDGAFDLRTFGTSTDTPLVGHFSSDDPLDDKVDMAFRRPFQSGGSFYRWNFRNFGQSTQTTFSLSGEAQSDVAVVADLDGDSIDEIGSFRSGLWRSIALGGQNQAAIREFRFGVAGDIPVAADYDGDGQADYAIFRPSTGDWWINRTGSGTSAVHFGQSGDVPIPADYDGDGKTDIAIYRNGVWWQLLSGSGSVKVDYWGSNGDIPIPAQLAN